MGARCTARPPASANHRMTYSGPRVEGPPSPRPSEPRPSDAPSDAGHGQGGEGRWSATNDIGPATLARRERAIEKDERGTKEKRKRERKLHTRTAFTHKRANLRTTASPATSHGTRLGRARPASPTEAPASCRQRQWHSYLDFSFDYAAPRGDANIGEQHGGAAGVDACMVNRRCQF